MLILGIETSQRSGSVALCRAGRLLEQRTLHNAGRRHASTLVAEIDEMFRNHAAALRDVEAVAVSIGPGSFTGLRVGVVCAKTLAYATGCRLAAVDTFLAVAGNSPDDVPEVLVVADAQRSGLFVGRYRRQADGAFSRLGNIAIEPLDGWCRSRTAGDVITGPGASLVEGRSSPQCRVLSENLRLPSAESIARLGKTRLAVVDTDDPWSLEPFYLRKSAAEEKAD